MREPAERDRSAPPCPGPAERAVLLPWLAPDAASLAALCRPTTTTLLTSVRHDPGALILLIRSADPASIGADAAACSLAGRWHSRLAAPTYLEEVLHQLIQSPTGWVDWQHLAVREIYHYALRCARWGEALARQTRQCDPDEAWVCGLLASLGWLAIAAVEPDAITACLGDPQYARQPAGVQRRVWGLDHAAIARRLLLRWRVPDTLLALIGRLDLPVEAAEALGADTGLLHVVRLAAGRARQPNLDLGLVGETSVALSAAALRLPVAVEAIDPPGGVGESAAAWQNPYEQPWLPALLSVGAELRRVQNRAANERIEYELDVLHEALGGRAEGASDRLQDAKLAALAEFAAGAGHEVNNPLAVISGQAQYLLNHQAEWFVDDPEQRVRKSLTTIIGQTRRIHSLLRDLMLFARPSPPRPCWIDLPTLLSEVAAAHAKQAEERAVRLDVVARVERLPICIDSEHLRMALGCLLRNAIEAAPANGWARLHLLELADDWIDIAIEDNGPGPEPAQIPSLFDPFFSGRSAGRGRGLGLPIAWRLARLQRGEVRLEPRRADGPTCFLLRLPRSAAAPVAAERGDAPTERPTGANATIRADERPRSAEERQEKDNFAA